tara:strand:+ start:9182 stop:10249 length:1068 start_codon:yes stop_codon:yes gene_type:complete
VKRTPLYEEHLKLGARMVDFAGWEMPLQYEGLKPEHLHVRKACGIFDVSHMGEIFFRGPKSLEALQWMTSNDVSLLKAGEAQYSLIPNEQGGIVDDIIVYCLQPSEEYLVCVNAANIDKDLQHFQKHNPGADISNESEAWAQIAIQGPKAAAIIGEIFAMDFSSMPSFSVQDIGWEGTRVFIAKTGYTGEDGCEVFIRPDEAPGLWQKLIGFDEVKAIGLGARDTLRLEKKFPLYGNELSDLTSPTAAKLNWVVKFDKGDFLGKQKMLQAKQEGTEQTLICLKMQDRGIPREKYAVYTEDEQQVGTVTSGTMSPSLGLGIAIAYVDSKHAKLGDSLWIDIRGRKAKALVVKPPFV